MLDLNSTLVIQIINFLILMFFMNRILYRPIRRALSQRKERMDSLHRTIEDFLKKSEESEAGIEVNKEQARKKGNQEKESCRIEGLEEERGIIQEASSSAEERIDEAKKDLENKMAEVKRALEGQVAVFSKELSEKILGRAVQ